MPTHGRRVEKCCQRSHAPSLYLQVGDVAYASALKLMLRTTIRIAYFGSTLTTSPGSEHEIVGLCRQVSILSPLLRTRTVIVDFLPQVSFLLVVSRRLRPARPIPRGRRGRHDYSDRHPCNLVSKSLDGLLIHGSRRYL